MALEAPQMVGDQLNPADVKDHTMIVIPIEFLKHVPTIHTKPGEDSPAIRVNVADLATGGAPVVYRGVLWFNALLHGGLRNQVGKSLLGRMVQGQGQPGKNPPWMLMDVTGESGWMDYGSQWLDTPEGQAFEAEAAAQIAAVSNNSLAAPAPAPAQAAAPAAAPPAPAGSPAPPAGPPVSAPAAAPTAPPAAAPTAPPAAPPAPTAAPPAPTAAPPAAELPAALAGLSPDELQKIMAVMNSQGQAAH